MISTRLLTNYLLAPTWASILIFLCFYFIILSISTNEIVFCTDNDIIVYKKKTMVLIEFDRIREYEDTIKTNEDTIKAQEDIIKAQDQMIKNEQNANKTARVIVGIEILLLGWCFLSALSSLFK